MKLFRQLLRFFKKKKLPLDLLRCFRRSSEHFFTRLEKRLNHIFNLDALLFKLSPLFLDLVILFFNDRVFFRDLFLLFFNKMA